LKSFLLHDTQDHITEIGSRSGTKISPKGSILVLVRGMTLHNDFPICRITQDMAFNQDIKAIISNESILDTGYLAYWLLASKYQLMSLVESASHGTGRINTDVLKSVKVSCPSLQKQKAISQILENFDAKIDNLRKQNETLEEIARSIFKHWFIDFEFPNADGKPYKSSGGVMVRSELGDIPEGWQVGIFQDFIENITDNRGKTPPTEENGILMMEGNQIICEQSFPSYSETSKQKYVSIETYNNWFRAGHPEYLDILCATVGTLPKWCFMPANKKICIAQNIIALRAKRQVYSPYWLRLFMNTRYFVQSVLGRLLTTAQPSIKVGHMMSIEVFIPELEISNKFSEIVKPLFQLIEVNSNQIQTLTKTRDTLLPKLMSGQLRTTI
jgi:type I restriction enzyme, S subunit